MPPNSLWSFTTSVFERSDPTQPDLGRLVKALKEDPRIQFEQSGSMILGWGTASPGAGKPTTIAVAELLKLP